MDRARLLKHFDTLADTPDAVAKLRQLVLQLAVEGRLLPREPAADTASGLAAELEKARAKAAAEGVAPKGKPLPIADTEKFIPDAPDHWIWLRLSQLGWIAGGSTPSMNNPRYWDGGVPWVTPKDMKSAEITSSEMSVSKLALESTSLRLYPKGSILIVGRSGILKRTLPVSVAAIECTVNQDLKVIVPFLEKLSPFIRLLLRGHETYILEHLVKGGMTVQSLKYDEFAQQAFPIPPLAEQKRIVARVEELLALCDELEARQTAAREQRTRLVHSAFDHLSAAANPADFRRHADFALRHFPHLTATPDSIPALRRTILYLAMQGRVVSQKPEETLTDSIPEITPQTPPLDVPNTWRWTEFGRIAQIAGGFAFKSGDYTSHGLFILRVTNIEPTGIITKNEAVYISPEKAADELERFSLNEGDILLVMVGGSLGKIGVVTADVLPALLNQNLWRITPVNSHVDRDFLRLLTDFSVSFRREITHSTHGHLSREEFRKKPVAVPPLAEQQRIVAKVAALMSWCDQLEAQLAAEQSAAAALLDSSLHALLAS